MDFAQAVAVVQQYQNDWRLPGLLEAMEQMQDSLDDLTDTERRAFRVVFNGMAKLLAPA